MPITMPDDQVLNPVHIRILVQETWGTSEWEALPYFTPTQGGFELDMCERVALPATGEARFYFRFGTHITANGVQISGAADQSAIDGRWSSDTDTTDLRDFSGFVVQIQAAESLLRPDDDSADWTTIWLGGCEYHTDTGWPAASIPAGTRAYFCTDLWSFFSRKWRNTEYSFAGKELGGSLTTYDRVRGAPQYNTANGERLSGNRLNLGNVATINGKSVTYHTWPGAADSAYWLDSQAIQHQIDSNRGANDPAFTFDGATDLYSTSGAMWEVQEGESVFSVINRICDRKRGRGCVFQVWSANGDTFDVYLRSYAQNKEDITYTAPASGSSETLSGASTNTTTVSVDLIGDHRVSASGFQIAARDLHRVDYLETIGEPIEVAFTVSFEDSTLVEGWATDSWETTFNAADADTRKQQKYYDAYSLYRLPRDWNLQAADGNGGTASEVNFRCDDAGSIGTSGARDIAPSDVQLVPDLPLFVPYDVTTDTPSRYDGDSETGPVQRVPFWDLTLLRTGDDTYKHLKKNYTGINFRLNPAGACLYSLDDRASGTRKIGDTAVSNLSSSEDYTDLVMTICGRLPHRVRLASGDASSERRRVLYVPDVHLWLWHSGAIWSFDDRDNSVLRGAYGGSGTTPGIARDDRDRLAFIHNLAWSWYGTTRQNCSWTIRACGLLGGFSAYQTDSSDPIDATKASLTTINYPIPGQLVTSLKANGETHTPNCPITRIIYDHNTMSTTWSCDWVELDFGRF